MTPRPAPTTTIATALLIAVAAVPLRDVFGDWRWTISVVGAVIAASLLASILETVRPGIPVSALSAITAGSAALWALLVSLRGVFWADPGSAAAWQELGDGIFDGWGALLDEQFPLTDPQSAETFATFFAWIAGATAIHVAARRRTALAAIASAAAVLAVSTAAALPRGLPPAVFGGAAGVCALFAIATLTRAPEQAWRVGRIVALCSVIAGAGALATLTGLVSTSVDRAPLDPRSARRIETVEIRVPDVLAEYGIRREQDQTVLTLESTAQPSGLRLRLQVYDTHNGERWVPAAEFEEIATFPDAVDLPPGDAVAVTVQIDELNGPWIPIPDRLTAIDLTDIRWNEGAQTMITDSQPAEYTVRGTLVSRADLEGIDSARDQVPESMSEAPTGLPDEIRTFASDATEATTDAVSAIQAIAAELRDLGRNETKSPGNSFARLRDDLEAARPTGAEQIASLHALMLRSVGIPSRLVVGYVANGPLVESADLHIWVEVPFPGIGWVAFDPVPAITDTSTDTSADDPTVPTTTERPDAPLQARALPRELGPGEDPDEAQIVLGEPFTLRDWITLVLVALAGVLALMIGIRLIRRRVRRSSGWRAEVRVLGAWAELVDRLRELGVPITSTTTTGDIVYMARAIDESLGAHTQVVASLAAIALHAPEGSEPDEATDAWDQLRLAESRITAVKGRLVLPRRFIDPRVLRYRAPRPPASRDGGRRSGATPPSPGR